MIVDEIHERDINVSSGSADCCSCKQQESRAGWGVVLMADQEGRAAGDADGRRQDSGPLGAAGGRWRPLEADGVQSPG